MCSSSGKRLTMSSTSTSHALREVEALTVHVKQWPCGERSQTNKTPALSNYVQQPRLVYQIVTAVTAFFYVAHWIAEDRKRVAWLTERAC